MRIHAAADDVRRVVPVSAAVVEPESDSTCTLSAGGDELEPIALYVGLLGHTFEVLDPPELAERCAEIGRRFLDAGR